MSYSCCRGKSESVNDIWILCTRVKKLKLINKQHEDGGEYMNGTDTMK